MKLETNRLYFRDYEGKDKALLQSMLTDQDMVRFIGDGRIKDSQETRDFLNRIYQTYEQNPEYGLKVLVRKEDQTAIGHAGIIPQFVDHREELEIGYWISRPYWRSGYASEAAEALKQYAFQHDITNRLIALIQPGNTGSIKVAEKIGMSLEKEVIYKSKKVYVYMNRT
ncbi:GNAT family N-acetyltransferase [Halobacillus rhizosphaerae]|uniref:GNAT family N-acetyltransferase n=1 Tax=Halobacillus rhizosphaerae TaxID=3064889 RepID=UPI00398B3793